MNTEDLVKDLPAGPLDSYRKQANFDWKKMKFFFEDPDLLKLKLDLWNTLEKDPIFKRQLEAPNTEDMKRISALQLYKYCQYEFLPKDTATLPYKRKTRAMMTVNEALAVTYPDTSVKHAVGISLFRNALTTLATERHQHILDASWNNKVLACLGLTEVAHGSNTKQMRTTAVYDPNTEEFIINTPDFEAAKCWVGNLGKTCTVALLFAQLYTKGQCYGLHAFIVPIRDPKTLLPYRGIVVGDMGEKICLHGIDNGFMMFNHYRIPRVNLLNRTADVTPSGDYESSFSEPGRILGAALENLSTGRVGIMQECTNNLICAVTIAVRYAAVRKQFSPNGDGGNNMNELPILEYQLHRWRLFPHMAAAAVLRVFVNSFTDSYLSAVELSTTSKEIDNLADMVSEIHAIISSAKPIITWATRDAIQECREACGGHGCLRSARFGELRCAVDPTVTYEGDNNVLMQQTSNWLLRQWQIIVSGNGPLLSPLGSCLFMGSHKTIEKYRYVDGTHIDVTSDKFITEAFEWLILYLVRQMHNKQLKLTERCDKFTARNDSQVYCGAVLSRAYVEYLAIQYYWREVAKADPSLVITLRRLSALYALSCLDKHLVYFYQGNYTTSPNFSTTIKNTILHLCDILKPDSLGVIDAMAPPDFVVNSVLGNSNGQVYNNLKTLLMSDPKAMSRPDWWQEIIIQDAPDFTTFKSKL